MAGADYARTTLSMLFDEVTRVEVESNAVPGSNQAGR